jgi:PAS domain S-box-containing protein
MNLRQFVKDLPIRRKLAYVTLVTCLVALAFVCAVLFWFQTVNFRRGFAAELESLGAIIASNSAAPLAFDDRTSATQMLKVLQNKSLITSAFIYDSNGALFASLGEEPPLHQASHGIQTPEVTFKNGYASLSLPIKLDETRSGHIDLRAPFGDRYRALLTLYAAVIAVVLVGSLVVILVLSSMLQKLITRPVTALVNLAEKVSEREDYSVRAVECGRDEIGLLTRTFNRMLDQIQSRDRRLHESQQRYEVAVMGSSDGLWDWNLDTEVVYFSPRWKEIIGFAEDEMENTFAAFRARVHPDDLPDLLHRIQAYLSGADATYKIEFRMRHKLGDDRWILSRGVALRSSEGKPIRFAGSHTDITDRKQTEEQIRLARAKFESLVNSIHGIVWEADPVNFNMQFVSDQAETILGHPADCWKEDPLFLQKSIHPADQTMVMQGWQRAVSSRKPCQLEYRAMADDGRIIWLRESVSAEWHGGHATRLRGLAIDITEQKIAAEQITRMQRELVDASRLAGMADVATGVLHNVGNVLNSVNVSANMVLEQIRKSKTSSLAKAMELFKSHRGDLGTFLSADPRGRQLPDFLEAISTQLLREQVLLNRETQGLQKNIEHIKQIVAMQQSYAKVTGAREPLQVHELVDDALRMASTSLVRHHIEIVREFEPAPPVLVDRHLVLQILVNLITNAKQALDHRDEFRTLVLRVTHPAGTRVRVEVTDNGMGIPSENLARIFNHGFTTKKSGHGFGLHSGANAAREMGGALYARSEGPGTGATFVLELPTEPQRAEVKVA